MQPRINVKKIDTKPLEPVRRTSPRATPLEPEPFCPLETIAETVEFFEQRLFAAAAVKRLSDLADLGASEAATALRRHIGVCYDVCHAAVEFEDPRQSIESLRGASISIAKVQLSCALAIEPVERASLKALQNFDEPLYLHQVVQRSADGSLRRYVDLSGAFESADTAKGSDWRGHFHVPIFEPDMEQFGTTQGFLREILALHREAIIWRRKPTPGTCCPPNTAV